MSKTIRYSEGLDVREARREAGRERRIRRFPVRATVYTIDSTGTNGWDRVEGQR